MLPFNTPQVLKHNNKISPELNQHIHLMLSKMPMPIRA
jgi:hypothetical protein